MLGRLLLALGLVVAPRPASAAPDAATSCQTGTRSALDEIACALRVLLGGTAAAPVVVGLVPASRDGRAPDPGLGVAVAVKLALELGPGAHAWPTAERPERAKALARGTRPMLLVGVLMVADRLLVTVDVLGPKSGAGAQPNPDAPIAQQRWGGWVDAEARRFLAPAPIAMKSFRRLATVESDTIALACGGIGPSSMLAVVSVGRRAVAVRQLEGELLGAPNPLRPWRDLVEVAPKPLREPLASVALGPTGDMLVGSTDRVHGKRMLAAPPSEWSGDPEARLPWPGGGCANLDGLLIAPRAVPCSKGGPPTSGPFLRDPLDAIAGARLAARTGAVRLVRAGRSGSDGSVLVTDGSQEVRLEHAGAAIALADMDGDGAPELATSLDTSDPSADALVVYSWLGAELKERLRVPVPDGVRAMAICPEREAAMAPVLVVTGGALWMLQ